MSNSPSVAAPIDDCQHDFREVYYGTECLKCGIFYAQGCAPWDFVVEQDEHAED